MKKIQRLLALLLVTIAFTTCVTSCKKDNVKLTPLASLNITNAVVGGTTAKFGSRATTISNNNFTQYSLLTGLNNLYIYPSTDSLHPYYTNDKFSVNQSEIYSLFLAGTTAAVDAILVNDTIPYRTDSTAGIRFINLSPNTSAKPINITLSTTPTVNEVSNLSYKQYTGFNNYLAGYSASYTFQIRNDTSAAPHAPLATIAFSSTTVPRFANVTVVIRQNGNGVGVFSVRNDR